MKIYIVLVSLFVASTSALPGRIIGGEVAPPFHFPHVASYQVRPSMSLPAFHRCGAVILNENWALSAAKCISEVQQRIFQIVVGKHDLTAVEPQEQRVNVSEIIFHEDFEQNVGPHNLALLRLETPLTFNEYVQPIALPPRDKIHTGEVVLAGWGITHTQTTETFTPLLHNVTLPLLDFTECERILSAERWPVDSTIICTGPVGPPVSACIGDFGTALTQYENGKAELVAIVSFVFFPCGASRLPVVNARISAEIDWLAKHMAT